MNCLLSACIISANIINGGSYTEKTPIVSVDNANIIHNIAHFYKIQNNQFNINGYLIFDTNTRLDLGYDNGLNSEKRNRKKALSIGLTQLNFMNDNEILTYGASVKIGGKVTDTPCRDESGMERLFHCDNLASLESFSQSEYENPFQVIVKYIYKF